MYVLIIVYYVKILAFATTASICVDVDPFIIDNNFLGKTFSAGSIVRKVDVAQKSTCASKCKKYHNCLSYFYNSGTKTCQLNSVVYLSTEGSENSSGNVYYRKQLECPSSPPKIENSSPQFDENNIETREGTELQYVCDDGYSQIGVVKCQIDGQWTQMICRKGCPDPPSIPHSTPQFDVSKASTTEGTQLEYMCDSGYVQSGNVTCQANTHWTTFTCIRLCPAPPTFDKADEVTLSGTYIEGDMLSYSCNEGYIAKDLINKITCLSNGIWTSITCLPIQSCSQIQKCRESYTDNDYWMYPPPFGGRPAKIYCHNLAGAAQEFVSLKILNIGRYPNLWNSNCDNEHVGPCSDNTTPGTTVYSKIKVDITNMEVDRENTTFANTTSGTTQKYGEANDCYCIHYSGNRCRCGPKGTFNIDLTGTGLKVDPQVHFKYYGWNSWGQAERSEGGVKIDLLCGGWSGGCSPYGSLVLKVDESKEPDRNSAISPRCIYN